MPHKGFYIVQGTNELRIEISKPNTLDPMKPNELEQKKIIEKQEKVWMAFSKLIVYLKSPKNKFPYYFHQDRAAGNRSLTLLPTLGTKEKPTPGVYQAENPNLIGIGFRDEKLYNLYREFLEALDIGTEGTAIPPSTDYVIFHNKQEFNTVVVDKASDPKKDILDKLDAYIHKINNHVNNNYIDFAFGFTWFRKRQASNRAVNYQLAVELRKLLREDNNALEDVFSESTIESSLRTFNGGPGHVIRSTDLNDIIRQARSYAMPEEDNTGCFPFCIKR